MNILKVGVTKVTPIETSFIYGAYGNFALVNCTEVRERLLKNGSKIIAGYTKSSNLANFTQKINKEGFVEQEKYYSSDSIGVKNKKTETQLEKITYNKIGDKLKHFILFKTFENGKLIERFEALMDIIKGIDRSERNLYKEEKTIIKNRINNIEYNEEIYKKGKLIQQTRKNDADLEGTWKF